MRKAVREPNRATAKTAAELEARAVRRRRRTAPRRGCLELGNRLAAGPKELVFGDFTGIGSTASLHGLAIFN